MKSGVTDVEAYQSIIMAIFQRKIPSELKVALPLNVDDPNATPYEAYKKLTENFAIPDPFVHDRLRAKVECRMICRTEKSPNT